MNVDFESVRRFLLNGREYLLQRADVTRHERFWSEWRAAEKIEDGCAALRCPVPSTLLKSKIMLTREDSSWIAYRLFPVDPGFSPGEFSMSYRFSDTSILKPYQVRAAAHLCNAIVRHGAAADGSDTGIGKTYHAAAVARDLRLRPAVICRKQGIRTWVRVLRLFNLDPLFVVNWEMAKGRSFPYVVRGVHPATGKPAYEWRLPPNVLLIFDEAHMGANISSQNSALWRASRGRASLSISATFADRSNRLKSLFSVLGIVPEEGFESYMASLGMFRNQNEDLESLSDQSDLAIFNRILFPHHGYRISYNDPDVKSFFPEAIFQTEIITLGKKQEILQNRLYSELLVAIEKYRALGKQAQSLAADIRYRQESELLKAPILADLAVNYIEQGHNVVIFVNFLDTLSYLSNYLKTNSVIYGEQERDGISREKVEDDFQSDRSRLIISTVGAGGQSISLHDVTGRHPRISLVCPTYDPIVLKQVLGRTHRAGGKSKPIIKLVYAGGTVEERVAVRVAEKLDNIGALNDGDLMEPDLFGILNGKDRHNVRLSGTA